MDDSNRPAEQPEAQTPPPPPLPGESTPAAAAPAPATPRVALGPVPAPAPAPATAHAPAPAALERSTFGAPALPAHETQPLPVESKRVLAGVMAILFGFIGLHKFILGYTGPGVVLLLVTFLGGICTLGVAWLATFTIGFIEGIVYLSKSDAEFVREYQLGRKEWF